MRFSPLFLVAFAVSVAAQSSNCGSAPNPFCVPASGYQFSAGHPTTITWTPTNGETVTLILRSGAATNLAQGTLVASNIANSGTYTWTPSASITKGADYALEIVDAGNPYNVNYSPQFSIDSSNMVASSTGLVPLAAPSSSLRLSAPSSASASATSASASSASASSASSAMMSSASSVSSAMSSASSAASSASSVLASMSSSMSSVSSSSMASMSSASSSSMSSMSSVASMSSKLSSSTASGTTSHATAATTTGTAAPSLSTGAANILEMSAGLLALALGVVVL